MKHIDYPYLCPSCRNNGTEKCEYCGQNSNYEMSTEQAIEEMKWVRYRIDYTTSAPEALKAIDMAIKALEQVKQDLNKDLNKDGIKNSIAEIYDKYMSADGQMHNMVARHCIDIIKRETGIGEDGE